MGMGGQEEGNRDWGEREGFVGVGEIRKKNPKGGGGGVGFKGRGMGLGCESNRLFYVSPNPNHGCCSWVSRPQADIALNKVQRKACHDAFTKGLIATVLLVVSHVMVNLLCACPCIVKTSIYRIVRVFYLVSIWIGVAGDGDYGKQKGTIRSIFLILSYARWWDVLFSSFHFLFCIYYIFATGNP
ncbi:hypothetical protein Fmac_021743 [Flemingia macrophylla]|uniref:Uncharacterized protein n=1 Tax=Flemingia macrophylla TaxID=520843 RepID=A0ABD1LXQ3_9FABA